MTSRRLQNAFFLSLVVLATIGFFGLIQDFLLPIFWAAVLATIFYPLNERCERWLGERPALAAVSTITIILVLVILPLSLTGFAVAAEVSGLYQQIVAGEIDPQAVIGWVETNLPIVTDFLIRFGINVDELRSQLSGAAVASSRFLATEALAFGQNAIRITGLTFVMLYLLFFFLRDGTTLLQTVIGAVPIGDKRERHLLNKFAEVARATLKGTLVIGLVQGSVGGILFWLLGINAAVLWGVVMGLLSLLPAVGAAIVWIPAAAILLFSGEILKGVALVIGGTVLIGLADNVLRPILVGRDTQMPDYLILVTTLGGLTLFGLSGVVIGPIIAALFLAVWDMFAREYSNAASNTVLGSVPALSGDEPSATPPEE